MIASPPGRVLLGHFFRHGISITGPEARRDRLHELSTCSTAIPIKMEPCERRSKHTSRFSKDGHITTWNDRQITAGQWKAQIDRHLEEADIILFLVSADFLASDYCYEIEMQRALERHRAGEALVIPVIIRTVELSGRRSPDYNTYLLESQ